MHFSKFSSSRCCYKLFWFCFKALSARQQLHGKPGHEPLGPAELVRGAADSLRPTPLPFHRWSGEAVTNLDAPPGLHPGPRGTLKVITRGQPLEGHCPCELVRSPTTTGACPGRRGWSCRQSARRQCTRPANLPSSASALWGPEGRPGGRSHREGATPRKAEHELQEIRLSTAPNLIGKIRALRAYLGCR